MLGRRDRIERRDRRASQRSDVRPALGPGARRRSPRPAGIGAGGRGASHRAGLSVGKRRRRQRLRSARRRARKHEAQRRSGGGLRARVATRRRQQRRTTAGRSCCSRRARSKRPTAGPRRARSLTQALAIAPERAAAAQFPRLCEARARRGSRRGRGDDPQGERARSRRCLDHRFAGLGGLQARPHARRRSRPSRAAAKGDPTQAEIHEHLGDALYKAGSKFEARFAWSAALVTAEDDVAARLKVKLDTGLTPATAAP